MSDVSLMAGLLQGVDARMQLRDMQQRQQYTELRLQMQEDELEAARSTLRSRTLAAAGDSIFGYQPGYQK